MTNRIARPREDPSRKAGTGSVLADKATAILTRPGDGFRARRLRKFARRHLDELAGAVDPWAMSEPIDWHGAHMDLGVPERDALAAVAG